MSADTTGKPLIAQIVACSRNRVIGRNGRLPWTIPEDWEFFLGMTLGGTHIMGRTTLHAMMGVPGWRENRHYIVVSSDDSLAEEYGVKVVDSVEAAIDCARADGLPIWICGGERIYAETMGQSDRLYLTLIDADIEGDAWFPEWSHVFKRVVSRRESSDPNFRYSFLVLEK